MAGQLLTTSVDPVEGMADRPDKGRTGSRRIVVFAVGYALVDLLPVLLPSQPELLGLGLKDLADAILVFVLVVLYVELAIEARLLRRPWVRAVFAVSLLLLVQGHAIHLAANAIAAASEPSASGWNLIYYLDEHWGHRELHLSFLLLAALFIFGSLSSAAAEQPMPDRGPLARGSVYGAALLYGLLLAGDAVEGQTVPLMLPGSAALFVSGVWPLIKSRSRGDGPSLPPHRRFFAISLGISAAALLIYGLVMGGYPELTSLGG